MFSNLFVRYLNFLICFSIWSAMPASGATIPDNPSLWLDPTDRSTMTFFGNRLQTWRDKAHGIVFKVDGDYAPVIALAGYGPVLRFGPKVHLRATVSNWGTKLGQLSALVRFQNLDTETFVLSASSELTNEQYFALFLQKNTPQTQWGIRVNDSITGPLLNGTVLANNMLTDDLPYNLTALGSGSSGPSSYDFINNEVHYSPNFSNVNLHNTWADSVLGKTNLVIGGLITSNGLQHGETYFLDIGTIVAYDRVLNASEQSMLSRHMNTVMGIPEPRLAILFFVLFLCVAWRVLSRLLSRLLSRRTFFCFLCAFAISFGFDAGSPLLAVPVGSGQIPENPSLWMDSTDLSTMTLSGDKVTSWRDKANGILFTAPPGAEPTIVPIGSPTGPVIRFTTGKYLKANFIDWGTKLGQISSTVSFQHLGPETFILSASSEATDRQYFMLYLVATTPQIKWGIRLRENTVHPLLNGSIFAFNDALLDNSSFSLTARGFGSGGSASYGFNNNGNNLFADYSSNTFMFNTWMDTVLNKTNLIIGGFQTLGGPQTGVGHILDIQSLVAYDRILSNVEQALLNDHLSNTRVLPEPNLLSSLFIVLLTVVGCDYVVSGGKYSWRKWKNISNSEELFFQET